MQQFLNLDSNGKYLIGASGGSDSMALLSLCLKEKYDVVVCHVNYKLRKNADKEEKLLKDFCKENGVKVYTLYPHQIDNENFQKWARDVRYDFYKRIYQQLNCSALLLGHQKDDSIENYLMSMERQSRGWYYGIPYSTQRNGMTIIRPLIQWRKKETRQYCLDNGVPFGDDESNFSDKYTRNKIRHQLIEPASDQQIDQWGKEIETLNNQMDQQLSYLKEKYDFDNDIPLDEYRNEDREIRHILIRYLMYLNDPQQVYSSAFIEDVDKQLNSTEENIFIPINETQRLVCEYGVFYICDNECNYSYVLNTVEYLQTEYFNIVENGQTIEGITLNNDDFPLIIRNYHTSDVIELRYGHKKVNRFFIDRKIKYRDRIKWPVVINSKNDVIFVPFIGCDVNHYSIKPSLFVVK